MHKLIKPKALFALALTSLFIGSAGIAPAAANVTFNRSAATEDAVTWDFRAFSTLVGTANAQDKHVLVYFWVGGSGQCEQFFRGTLQDPAAAKATEDFICYSAGHSDAAGAKLFERYSITTVPAIRILNGHGEAIDGINGYADVAQFTSELARIEKGEGTLTVLKNQVEAAPDDLDLRNLLAGKYLDLGKQETHDELQDSIRKDDPLGKSDIGANLLLSDVITAAGAKATRPTEVDLKPIYALAGSLENQAGSFQLWNWLSYTESTLGNKKAEMAATHEAWARYSDSLGSNWLPAKVDWMLSMPSQLSKADKALALEMASAGVEFAGKELEGSCGDFGCDDGGECKDECKESETNGKLAEATQRLSRAYELNGMTAEAKESQQEGHVMEASYSDTRPVWSPNGKDVLFTSDRDGNQELYLVKAKKGTPKRLTFTQSNETSGSFGAKGKTIAFNTDRFGIWTAFTMSTKGKNVRIVQPVDPDAPFGLSDVSYSPNGKRIAYCTTVNGKSEIAVADKDGKNEVILTAGTESSDSQPVWSAKGDQILYISTRMGDADVYTMSADGEGDRNVTNAPKDSWDMDGHRSANGKSIVFASWRTGKLDVYRMNVDGTEVVNLTDSETTEDRHPQFSPDGKRILFERKDAAGFARLWTMDFDGSNQVALMQ